MFFKVKKVKIIKCNAKRTKYKPLYKKFFRLYENVQDLLKLTRFRKEKWETMISRYINSKEPYRLYKPKNPNQYTVCSIAIKGAAYNKRYRDSQQAFKRLRLMYGGLGKKGIKKQVNYLINKNYKNAVVFIKLFEKRLDVVLCRSKFCPTVWTAQQLILHGQVLVNNKEIRSKSYKLQLCDLISIKFESSNWLIKMFLRSRSLYRRNKSYYWPPVPKHLTVNYKTLQIVFGHIKSTNLSTLFLFDLKLEKMLNKFI